jgi:LPXTG-motif cell wall-anchored protein
VSNFEQIVVSVNDNLFGRLGMAQEAAMDTTTLLIIVIVLLVIGGGGWYGRRRWF